MTSSVDRPNTLSGLVAKRNELVRYRDQLEADIRAVTVDIDHLEAAIRIFDPERMPAARRRYAALHRASGPLTSRDLADMRCRERGLTAKDSTLSMMRKRIGATLKALHHEGAVRQEGYVEGRIGWRTTT